MRIQHSLPSVLIFFATLFLDSFVITSLSPFWRSSRSHVFAFGMLINTTVDDTSSQIDYLPEAAWHPSNISCRTCFNPAQGLAYQQTWHNGMHIIPTLDADDFSNPEHHPDSPFFTAGTDSDDKGFVDHAVFAEFNFTGSAVYVFALLPLFAAPANSTPTLVYLSFTLDSQPDGNFIHNGTQHAPGDITLPSTTYQPNALVYTRAGLSEGYHSLRIDVRPDSVFLLDYITYSQDDESTPGGNTTQNDTFTTPEGASPTDGPQPGSSKPSTISVSHSTSKPHNVATFAGAVGGSVGFLALLSLSLAFSIYRRRALARRRDRRLRAVGAHARNFTDSFHTDASEDTPPMEGPAPFVPRYFPGSVPLPPPPYIPPVSPDSAEATTPLLTSVSPVHTPLASTSWSTNRSGDLSYADRPPPTPPPELEEEGFHAAPPSFSVAISSPVPAIFAQLNNVSAALASHSIAFVAAQAQRRAQLSRRSSRTNMAEQGMNHEGPDFRSSHSQNPSLLSPRPLVASRPVSLRQSLASLRQSDSSPENSEPTVVPSISLNGPHSNGIPHPSSSEIPLSIPPSTGTTGARRDAGERPSMIQDGERSSR